MSACFGRCGGGGVVDRSLSSLWWFSAGVSARAGSAGGEAVRVLWPFIQAL